MARVHDNGCFFTVSLSQADVTSWAQSWPCFDARRAAWFQFDKRNGDLIGMDESLRDADPSGVLALSHDAQAYGAARLAGRRVKFRAELALQGAQP